MSRADSPVAPRRALIVSLDQLGDLVFASALVAPLLERFPGIVADVWCREYLRDIAALIPGIDRVFTLRYSSSNAFGTSRGAMSDLVRAVRSVRPARHDVAILAAAPWRTAAAVALTRIPMRIGLARHRNRFFLTHVLPAADRTLPVVQEEARLLAPLGIETPPKRRPAPRLDPGPLTESMAQIRSRTGGERPLVTLHAFASDRRRCAPLEVWRAVARTLSDRGFGVAWLGAREELEQVRQADGDAQWIYSDRVTGGSLRDAAALTAVSTVFVGHDSGPLHVANALGIPCVGVYAPGEPLRTFPQGPAPWRLVHGDRPDQIRAAGIVDAISELAQRGQPA